jgi:hypothetical protein
MEIIERSYRTGGLAGQPCCSAAKLGMCSIFWG